MNPPPIDPFDLGLEDVSKYPECAACRKKSDGAKPVAVRALGPEGWLCGTHYDEWICSPECCESPPGAYHSNLARFAAFVERLRTTRYAACWAAKEEGHG